MISSRKIEDLHPAVQKLASAHMEACKEANIDLLIYCTYRDIESQNALYKQGRETTGSVVTNARGGESYHNWRCAYDCVALVQGKPQWGDSVLARKVGELGESVGLEWSGRWAGKLKESAHFQYTGGYTLKQLQAGAVPQ